MNKKTILLSLTALGATLVFSSYKEGLGRSGLNQTGAAGTVANCSGGGCHASNTAATFVSINLLDNGVRVSDYTPGKAYRVQVVGQNSTGATLPNFGFQFATVLADNTGQQAGTLSPGGTAGLITSNVGSLQLLENGQSLQGVTGGSFYSYVSEFSWTAPATGGKVRMYLTLNACDGDGSRNGDQPNATSRDFDANQMNGVNDISPLVSVRAFPSPFTDRLTVQLPNQQASELCVFDAQGRMVYCSHGATVSGAATIPTHSWTPGLYRVKITQKDAVRTLTVVKQ